MDMAEHDKDGPPIVYPQTDRPRNSGIPVVEISESLAEVVLKSFSSTTALNSEPLNPEPSNAKF